nr:hypothetical protein [Nitrospirota bacterium]
MDNLMKAERLALWYFRLNGFFTITNFVLHPSRRGGQRTDADIVGVRFPYRSEFPDSQGGDETEFTQMRNKPYFVIAEVKRSLCQLNGPWTNQGSENIQSVLNDLGLFPNTEIQAVAESLYTSGRFDDSNIYCSLFCLGDSENAQLLKQYPLVPQRTWKQVLEFIFQRFETYHKKKADHDSWDEIGKDLWRLWEGKTKAEFVSEGRKHIGLSST